MYIHNISDQIDDFGHLGMVNPNTVSGADLDQRIAGFYGYVSDEEIVAAEQAYQETISVYQEAQKAVQSAGMAYSRAMGGLKSSNQRLTLLKAIVAGTAKGTSYDGKHPDGIKAEISDIQEWQKSESAKLDSLKQASAQASNNVKVAYQAMLDAKAEIENLTQRQVDEGKPPVENTYKITIKDALDIVSGTGIVGAGSGGTYQGGGFSLDEKIDTASEVVAKTVKKDLITKIGDTIGLSRQHTIFALGGAAVLGVVILTKK